MSQEHGHSCAFCDYSTINKANLLFHALGIHLHLTPYQCPLRCDLRTTNYTNVRQHLRRKHNVADADHFYRCSECELSSVAPLGIIYHYFETHVNLEELVAENTAILRQGRASHDSDRGSKDEPPDDKHKSVRDQMSLRNILN
mmetsp:Transcript_3179/g.5600  ORF Transcript_3179/g.5600 Transcript_3179/m.5600 type:complete len:143 (+) Transcript_3179:656-1084(+)